MKDQFNHTWTHRFDDRQSAAERAAWIEQTLRMARHADIALIHRETENGVEFAFFDQDHWAAFALNLTVEGSGRGDHRHTQHFDTPLLQSAWTNLARSYLDQAGIEYEINAATGRTEFRFRKLADRIVFNQLVDSGLLDEGATMLQKIRAFQGRIAGLDGPHYAL